MTTVRMAPTPENSYLLDAFLQGTYSDMKITCGDFTFNVHRLVVCSQSSFLEGALRGGFKESINGVIDLPDDDIECVERILSFLYVKDYNETGHTMDLKSQLNSTATDTSQHPSASVPQGALNNIDVYIAADKFGISSLKKFSGARVKSWMRCNVNIESSAFMTAANKILDCGPDYAIDPTLEDYLVEAISESFSNSLVNQALGNDFFPLIRKSGVLGAALVERLQAFNKQNTTEWKKKDTESKKNEAKSQVRIRDMETRLAAFSRAAGKLRATTKCKSPSCSASEKFIDEVGIVKVRCCKCNTEQ
ncbi:hypothetical protein N7481_002162 [Penicillium waksmanii]|uniref:uncharacterized protein n=1 Tax=Penicillium waksmanii TaxID=69791 RepID=UPI00254929E4|nr:uncharacterized protein N7481_002162 [Penicillium waksmanii]KAJ5995185.1 hypothetical protein N7481_002162 [Penicillium waksmanii]